MLTIVLMSTLLLGSTELEPAVDQPAATRLALELAENWGTRVQSLSLLFEEINTHNQEAIEAAVVQTKLFELSPSAPHRLTIRRIDTSSVLVVLSEAASASRLWVSQLS